MINGFQKLPWTAAKRLKRQLAALPLQQDRNCPLCGYHSSEELFSLSDFQFFTDDNGINRADHRIVLCDNCGLLYTNPCYTREGFQLLFEKAGLSYGHTEGRIREQVAWLKQRFPEAASLVDIGCGNGDLLGALPKTIQRYGLDVDERTLAVAGQRSPEISFGVCDFDGLEALPQVDVITLFHVLEHLANPADFLRSLRQLSPSSVSLVVEVPIIDRAVQEQDSDIVGFFTIQHLTHFSQFTLNKMLVQCGWKVVYSEAMPGYNGWRVIAEPGAAIEQASGKDQSVLASAQAYMDVWRKNVARVKQRIEYIKSADRIMVWGAGQHTEYLALLTDLFEAQASFVLVDSDPLKQGETYHGIPVLAPAQISDEIWTKGDFPIVISTYGGQQSILSLLESKVIESDRIITLYEKTLRY